MTRRMTVTATNVEGFYKVGDVVSFFEGQKRAKVIGIWSRTTVVLSRGWLRDLFDDLMDMSS